MEDKNDAIIMTIMSAELVWRVKDLVKSKDVYAIFEYDGVKR